MTGCMDGQGVCFFVLPRTEPKTFIDFFIETCYFLTNLESLYCILYLLVMYVFLCSANVKQTKRFVKGRLHDTVFN